MEDECEPQTPPRLSGYESWLYQIPRTGAGDFFVSMPLPAHAGFSAELPNRWLVAIGDFSWTWREDSRLKDLMEAETRRLAGTAIDPASILDALNNDPLGTGDVSCVLDSYACLLVALVDSDRQEMTFASAGHVSPLVRRVNRQTELLAQKRRASPLDRSEPDVRECHDADRSGRDYRFLLGWRNRPDGQPEQSLPPRALRQAISQARGDASSVGQSILEATRRFGQGRAQIDDISLLCVGRALQQASHKRGD